MDYFKGYYCNLRFILCISHSVSVNMNGGQNEEVREMKEGKNVEYEFFSVTRLFN
ncbi:hypothetical protein JHK82_019508 [Glycine max]|uniref:Uncharacterized protein n=2 Tax=Glycine subgen. Soja TaxID=1462606 RepID=K7L369_SOYBN|nr:hypothetical protein JHK85_019947 [Glycine max]RZC04118.1 hypothetical protein D0Y65_018650 [Glycine soja]KAG5038683.1 hypothetical protein JHK86_019523 [Glycine max]KAG5143813.1 hypothetical protein JHK82_019508 [Glycine max]KAH1088066.1 hypothetical protein GYH30_019222 [Glycine max]